MRSVAACKWHCGPGERGRICQQGLGRVRGVHSVSGTFLWGLGTNSVLEAVSL